MSNEKKETRAGEREREGDTDTCYRERIVVILMQRLRVQQL